MPAEFEFTDVLHSPLHSSCVVATSQLGARSYFLILTQYCVTFGPLSRSRRPNLVIVHAPIDTFARHMYSLIHSDPLLPRGVPN